MRSVMIHDDHDVSHTSLTCLSAGVGPQQNETKDWNLGLDYNKYLQQVVEVMTFITLGFVTWLMTIN